VQAIGGTTKLLTSKGAGDSLLDVVGPLGNPTPIENHGVVACVGGGVGTAELFPIAQASKPPATLSTLLSARGRESLSSSNRKWRPAPTALRSPQMMDHTRGKDSSRMALKALLDLPGSGVHAVYAIGPCP